MSKAAKGGGSLRQRTDGRWEGRYTYTDDLGRPARGSVYAKTQRECRQMLAQKVIEIDEGTFAPETHVALTAWLGHYSSAFTMDTYAAVSQQMRRDTQSRMDQVFKAANGSHGK